MSRDAAEDIALQHDKRIKILIIEDDQSYSRLALSVLSGYPRHTAATGKRGLELFQQMQPDITFLDIALPDVNGLDMLAHMKKLYPEAFIIMLTASRVAEDVEKAKYLGAAGYIAKPFSRGKMLAYLDLYQKYIAQIEQLDSAKMAQLYQECFDHAKSIELDFAQDIDVRQEKHALLNQWRMLYVDDVPENGLRVKKRLEQAGRHIEIASSPDAALEAVTRYHYDMVFVLQEMRTLPGVELVKQLRATEHWMPIAMITQDKSLAADPSLKPLHIAHFIQRPVKSNTLLAVIGLQIEKSLNWQESEYIK